MYGRHNINGAAFRHHLLGPHWQWDIAFLRDLGFSESEDVPNYIHNYIRPLDQCSPRSLDIPVVQFTATLLGHLNFTELTQLHLCFKNGDQTEITRFGQLVEKIPNTLQFLEIRLKTKDGRLAYPRQFCELLCEGLQQWPALHTLLVDGKVYNHDVKPHQSLSQALSYVPELRVLMLTTTIVGVDSIVLPPLPQLHTLLIQTFSDVPSKLIPSLIHLTALTDLSLFAHHGSHFDELNAVFPTRLRKLALRGPTPRHEKTLFQLYSKLDHMPELPHLELPMSWMGESEPWRKTNRFPWLWTNIGMNNPLQLTQLAQRDHLPTALHLTSLIEPALLLPFHTLQSLRLSAEGCSVEVLEMLPHLPNLRELQLVGILNHLHAAVLGRLRVSELTQLGILLSAEHIPQILPFFEHHNWKKLTVAYSEPQYGHLLTLLCVCTTCEDLTLMLTNAFWQECNRLDPILEASLPPHLATLRLKSWEKQNHMSLATKGWLWQHLTLQECTFPFGLPPAADIMLKRNTIRTKTLASYLANQAKNQAHFRRDAFLENEPKWAVSDPLPYSIL